MLKAQLLNTSAKSNPRDRVLDEVEKNSLMLCQAKWGTAGSCPENYVIRTWEDLMRSFTAIVKGWGCSKISCVQGLPSSHLR